MSKLRVLSFAQSLVLWAIVSLSLGVFSTSSVQSAWADEVSTGGQSDGLTSGIGNGDTVATVVLHSDSEASTKGRRHAFGQTATTMEGGVDQGDTNANNSIRFKTSATARVTSSKRKIEAYASANVSGTANANEASNSANALVGSGGEAYASSNRNSYSAYAGSTSGAYALAIAGQGASLTAYVPGATQTIIQRGNKTIAIAYTETGSYSIAIVKRNSARAITGTSANAAALAAGDVKAIIKSAMYAEAYADRSMAMAFASASINGLAQTSAGSAQVYGQSVAFAKVIRFNKTSVVIAVATSKDGHSCGSHWWTKKVKNQKCIVIRKTIPIKFAHK